MQSRDPGPGQSGPRNDLKTIRTMVPYLWPANEPEMRFRVVAAAVLLALAKGANVVVPFFYKYAVDALSSEAAAIAAVPVVLLIAYGATRVLAQAFGELRDAVFTRVAQRAIRRAALKTGMFNT